ncbi:MAG: hypothetical protein AB1451_15375 [Nitrospirota bacterium]
MKTLCVTAMGLALLAISGVPAPAFEVDTHMAINERAVRATINSFSLDEYLKTQLNFSSGVLQTLDDQRVIDWVRKGGKFEDNGLRFFHHFHDPLKPWDASGFKGLFSSSILWGQTQVGGQSLFGDWSWHDARDYYYRALTAGTSAERKQYFAKTFRAIGQVMHLAEDVAGSVHVAAG